MQSKEALGSTCRVANLGDVATVTDKTFSNMLLSLIHLAHKDNIYADKTHARAILWLQSKVNVFGQRTVSVIPLPSRYVSTAVCRAH